MFVVFRESITSACGRIFSICALSQHHVNFILYVHASSTYLAQYGMVLLFLSKLHFDISNHAVLSEITMMKHCGTWEI